MKDVLDAIIYYDELSKDQQVALHDSLASEPDLLRMFNRWQVLKEEVRNNLDASIPNREQLVLFALQQQKEDYLTLDEHSSLNASLPALERALQKHPALHIIIDDIKKAQDDFLQLWPDTKESKASPSRSATIFQLSSYRILSNRLVRVAAVFLIACVSFYSAFSILQNYRIETITNTDDAFRTVHFDDGSKVRLVGASELSFAKPGLLSSFDREVKLAGQAFFDISPNKKPFTVESATAITRATGTQFSVDAQPGQTEVVLTNGNVTVASNQGPGSPITLAPGERSQILLGQPPSIPETVTDMTAQLSWTGLFIFHHSPLSSVTSYLSDHFDAVISVAESLEEEPFKASFDPDTLSLDEALETLTIAFDARVDTVDSQTDSYLLTPFIGE